MCDVLSYTCLSSLVHIELGLFTLLLRRGGFGGALELTEKAALVLFNAPETSIGNHIIP